MLYKFLVVLVSAIQCSESAILTHIYPLSFLLSHPSMSCDSGITLLGIKPEKNIMQKNTCTPVFTEALFTIAQTWKLSNWLLTDECIKKMQYICRMEYCSAIKKTGIGTFVEMWMDLEPAIFLKWKEELMPPLREYKCFYICLWSVPGMWFIHTCPKPNKEVRNWFIFLPALSHID